MAKTSSEAPKKASGKGEESVAKDGEEKAQRQGPRKRVSQACNKCRARKDKCDGTKPTCSTCIAAGRTCSYDANVKKRGLPEGYVRGLEKLWGLAIRDVDEVEENILSALAVDEDIADTPLGIWNDEATSESLVEIWRKSQIWRELERLLSSQEPTIADAKRKRTTSDLTSVKRVDPGNGSSGPNQSEDRALFQVEALKSSWPERGFDQRPPNDFQHTPSYSAIDDTPAFGIRDYDSILSPPNPTTLRAGTPAASVQVEAPELPTETWNLIDVYFSYTHPWLPIIERHDLLKTSYQYGRSGSTSSFASGENAVLWAAIAYAKFQHRSIHNIPRAIVLGAVGEMVWTAERMYSQARSLIPDEEGILELGHVQALLILTLANMGMGRYSRAWSLVGQAVRSAIELQLDNPSDTSKRKNRSKHVFLGCFALDTLVSARLSRKPHLRSDDLHAIGLIDEDGLEEWDPWADCLTVRRYKPTSPRVPASILSTFNGLISVLKILNQALCLPASSKNLQSSIALVQKLEFWSQSQPPPLYYNSTSDDSEQARSLLPHQYHLRNVYFSTLVTSQLLSHKYGTDSVNLEPCTRSARSVVDLLSRHSDSFGMLIVPPTYEYFVKTAYDVVHAVNSSIESTHLKINDWRHRLDRCLDALEPAWDVFERTKTAHVFQASPSRRQSQVAYDLISGMSQDPDYPMAGQTPQSLHNLDMHSAYSPQSFKPQSSSSLRGVAHNPNGNQTSHRSSFGQSSGHGMPQNPLAIYQNAHVTFGNLKPDKSAAQPSKATPPQQSLTILTPTQPSLHRSLTTSSTELDLADPLFNELMRLDATEWAGTSYQSLVNLGFSSTDDPANVSQDFYAFCQDPDPLVSGGQNNVWQQLMNGANTEAMEGWEGSAFGAGGIEGLGIAGFDFGAGSGESNSMGQGDGDLEVGQILAGLRKS